MTNELIQRAQQDQDQGQDQNEAMSSARFAAWLIARPYASEVVGRGAVMGETPLDHWLRDTYRNVFMTTSRMDYTDTDERRRSQDTPPWARELLITWLMEWERGRLATAAETLWMLARAVAHQAS